MEMDFGAEVVDVELGHQCPSCYMSNVEKTTIATKIDGDVYLETMLWCPSCGWPED